MDVSSLPTTIVGLIAFLTLANLGTLGYLVRYFLTNQKAQTKVYMDYITTKNGILERVTKDFNKALEEQQVRSEKSLADQGARHKEMFDDMVARLDSVKSENATKRRRK